MSKRLWLSLLVLSAACSSAPPKPLTLAELPAINTDRNLRLQYLAGRGLNLYQSDLIYRSMIRDSRYPEDLFEGSPQTLQALRARIDASLGGAPQF